MDPLSRREWLRRLSTGAAALALGGCKGAEPTVNDLPIDRESGRLGARPGAASAPLPPGQHALGLGPSKDGFVYIPPGLSAPAPLALLLHGAGQRAPLLLDPMKPLADETGMVLLAVDSREATWDIQYAAYRNDIPFIDSALALAFRSVAVDPARVTVAGFSDGASYALSIGRINGDLFGKIAAFSPGYFADGYPRGLPRMFITHGTGDPVLGIDNTSRRIVPVLRFQGYPIDYVEFEGGHEIPAKWLRTAALWLAAATAILE